MLTSGGISLVDRRGQRGGFFFPPDSLYVHVLDNISREKSKITYSKFKFKILNCAIKGFLLYNMAYSISFSFFIFVISS